MGHWIITRTVIGMNYDKDEGYHFQCDPFKLVPLHFLPNHIIPLYASLSLFSFIQRLVGLVRHLAYKDNQNAESNQCDRQHHQMMSHAILLQLAPQTAHLDRLVKVLYPVEATAITLRTLLCFKNPSRSSPLATGWLDLQWTFWSLA